jgi:transcriptional regulator with XRE-family HTH domain
MATVAASARRPPVGALLREWRQRRRLGQLELALRAGISTRHISFVETGRARPSRDMVLHLGDQLEVPLRERNDLLLLAGYAPAFTHGELGAPELEPVRVAILQLLRAHEPFPALVIDHHWGLVEANRGFDVLTEGVAASLLEPPVNVLRLCLHPDGLASRVVNLHLWRTHILERVTREALISGDPALAALRKELVAYPAGAPEPPLDPIAATIAVPLRIRVRGLELAFIGTRTKFGMPSDVTVAELSIESLYPADERTAETMRAQLERSG